MRAGLERDIRRVCSSGMKTKLDGHDLAIAAAQFRADVVRVDFFEKIDFKVSGALAVGFGQAFAAKCDFISAGFEGFRGDPLEPGCEEGKNSEKIITVSYQHTP